MFVRHPCSLLIATSVSAVLLFTASAHAIPDFDSTNGKFSFSNFSATGSAYSAANISIAATENGFDIIMNNDAMRVGAYDGRDLAIRYKVSANAGLIVSAALSFEAQVLGNGALANVSEDYSSQSGNLLIPPGLTVFATDAVSVFFDSQGVGKQEMMTVEKDILVTNFGGEFAEITRISQTFATAIPEPSAALLFVVGAGVVATCIGRRS